ncbi:MAG: energy transducer TonB, partial [Myxococcota bacterium]
VSLADTFVLAPLRYNGSPHYPEGVRGRHEVVAHPQLLDGQLAVGVADEHPPAIRAAVMDAARGWRYHERYLGMRVPPVRLIFTDEDETMANVPLRRIDPIYPRSAAQKGVSGYTTIAFCVDKSGRPVDLSIIASEPPGVFDRSSMRAIRKWEFPVRYRDGKPTRWCNEPLKMEFKL